MLECVLKSNLSLYDYLQISINNWMCNNYQTSYECMPSTALTTRPIWATSDLTVRLNWLNWNNLGILNDFEIRNFLDLFKLFGDLTRDKAVL